MNDTSDGAGTGWQPLCQSRAHLMLNRAAAPKLRRVSQARAEVAHSPTSQALL